MLRSCLVYRVAAFAAFLLPALGCDAGPGPLAAVRGKVAYKGVALRGGSIVFTPDAARGNVGPLAHGVIQADGSYTLRTGDALGAVPGWHRVTVVAVELPARAATGGRFVVPRSLLPDKYGDPNLSKLSCEVVTDKQNHIDFNLQ